MFDRIVYISDHSAKIRLVEGANITMNLMNLHLIFEDANKKILGEIDDIDGPLVEARFLGEIVDGKLIGGTIRKPTLDAHIRTINPEEIPLIVGSNTNGYLRLGLSPFYNNQPIYLNVNEFFSNHFAIFGNSGSGKSCGISRLFQNLFHNEKLFPFNANILFFDSSGEYFNAFRNLNSINKNYHYRFISTNERDSNAEPLRIPIYLLSSADIALLLQADKHSQLPMIERMVKIARVFSQTDMDANVYKNHLIAKAIMTVLYTNETSPNKRNEIFSILASCSTKEFNLDAVLQGIGYTRKFRDCFLIDNKGQFSESVLLTEYVMSFIKEDLDNYEPKKDVFYTLDTLEKALNFTLISEGWLRNKNTYGDAVTLKVRLHSLIVSGESKYFEYSDFVSVQQFISSLVVTGESKYQIVNINFDDVDDDFAKVITKVFSRLIFEYARGLEDRASLPFHIVVEEAHRYIQNDTDNFLIGYNIFERIAKEGRKYGVLLGLISQRPVDLSDTVISQCSNFLIFKMSHPVDVEYIRKMVPNISEEIVEKQKTLQSGTCLGFGTAFRIPLIVKMEMPDPAPWSGNCNVVKLWNGNGGEVDSSIAEDIPEKLGEGEETNDVGTPETVPVTTPVTSPETVPVTTPVASPETVPPTSVPSQYDTVVQIPTFPKIETPVRSVSATTKPVEAPSQPNIPIVPSGSSSSASFSSIQNLAIPRGMSAVPMPENRVDPRNMVPVPVDTSRNGNFIMAPSMPVTVPPTAPIQQPKAPEPSAEEKQQFLMASDEDVGKYLSSEYFASSPAAASMRSNNAQTFAQSGNVTDQLLDGMGINPLANLGGVALNNMSVQSAIPDFTTSSKDEDDFFVPQNTYEIPTTRDIAASKSAVSPTIDLGAQVSDYGKVTIAPPSDSDGSVPLVNFIQ